jgi:hypothetical protein
MRVSLILFVFICFFADCTVKQPSYPIVPAVVFKEYSRPQVMNMDTFSLVVSFTDGDGDIGIRAGTIPRNDTVCITPNEIIKTNPGFNIFYTDLRDGCMQFARTEFYDPPPKNKSTKGEIVLNLAAFCKKVCTLSGCNDTARFEIILRDRSGNFSNPIVTPPLVITGCF